LTASALLAATAGLLWLLLLRSPPANGPETLLAGTAVKLAPAVGVATPPAQGQQDAAVSGTSPSSDGRRPSSIRTNQTASLPEGSDAMPPRETNDVNAKVQLEPAVAPALAPVPLRELSVDSIQIGTPTVPDPPLPGATPPGSSAPPASPWSSPEVRPVRITEVKPAYPPLARAADLEGEVTLEITVDPNGRVTQSKIVRSTDSRFNRAALDAVNQWRYRPGLRASVPSAFTIEERVFFRLKDK
jgi:periplasmic protein TonB